MRPCTRAHFLCRENRRRVRSQKSGERQERVVWFSELSWKGTSGLVGGWSWDWRLKPLFGDLAWAEIRDLAEEASAETQHRAELRWERGENSPGTHFSPHTERLYVFYIDNLSSPQLAWGLHRTFKHNRSQHSFMTSSDHQIHHSGPQTWVRDINSIIPFPSWSKFTPVKECDLLRHEYIRLFRDS